MSSPAPPDRGRGAGRRGWDGNGGPEAGRLQRGSPASPPPHPRAPDPISIPPPPSTCSPLPRPAGQEHKVTDKVKSAVVGAAEKAAPPPPSPPAHLGQTASRISPRRLARQTGETAAAAASVINPPRPRSPPPLALAPLVGGGTLQAQYRTLPTTPSLPQP